MVNPCPDCGTGMLPADDMDCEKANFVCPKCAPDFVVANASNYSETEDPLPQEDDK